MQEIMRRTVLMLDHEPMLIDRRIVLEGQTLVKHGWRVVLATRGDGVKPSFEIERGIEVHRFTDPNDEILVAATAKTSVTKAERARMQLALDRQRVLGWIHAPANIALKDVLGKVKLPPRIASFVYQLAWPPEVASTLRRRHPRLKRLLGLAFEPIVYAALFRPQFLVPYLRLSVDRLSTYLSRTFTSNYSESKETWETRVANFARELQPQIIHAHDLPNLPAASQLAEELKAVLIYDAHELYPMQYFSDERRRQAALEMEGRLILKADAVISVNAQCAEVLEREYKIGKVVSLTNAMEDPIGFVPTNRKRLWHERFSLDPNVKLMVFQGGINPVRNIDPLVEALAETPHNIHIGFITYGKDIPYYKEMASRLGLDGRIHYVVEIPWHEVNDWLCSADVGIMPYQVTNYNAKISSPNKLYEFVVAGLPIIASTELDNVKIAIERDKLGVMTLFRGVETYRDAILQMFVHPDGPERFRPNVIAARHKYLWSNEEPKLLNLYHRISSDSFKPRSSRDTSSHSINDRANRCAE